jgi:hypothetical protein
MATTSRAGVAQRANRARVDLGAQVATPMLVDQARPAGAFDEAHHLRLREFPRDRVDRLHHSHEGGREDLLGFFLAATPAAQLAETPLPRRAEDGCVEACLLDTQLPLRGGFA